MAKVTTVAIAVVPALIASRPSQALTLGPTRTPISASPVASSSAIASRKSINICGGTTNVIQVVDQGIYIARRRDGYRLLEITAVNGNIR